MKLVWPSEQYLPDYVRALERGWAPNNERIEEARREELEAIANDPQVFLAALVDREAQFTKPAAYSGGEALRFRIALR